jgi:hypothetical protein
LRLLTISRLGFGFALIFFLFLAQHIVNAGSTGLNIVAFSGGTCSIGGGTTNFTVRIAYNSATGFDYVASVVSGPPGLGGTSNGTVPAGSSANTPIGLTFNSVATAPPWSLVVQIDSFVGGNPQDRATATVSCPAGGTPYTVTPISSIDISVPSLPPVVGGAVVPVCINDSRINRLPNVDCAAPVAVYRSDAGLSIFGINPSNSRGTESLFITSAEIDEVGIPDSNTLIASGTNSATGQPIHVYRLASGEYQLNTYYADGKPYIISWDSDGNVRHIAN